jgi:outer membrane protein TolC
VKAKKQTIAGRAAVGLFAALALAAGARAQNPTSAVNSFWGSVTAEPMTGEPLRLSLDDAIARGLKNNLGLKEAENSQKALHGQRNEALQAFLPTITLAGDTGYYTHNLVSMGFTPSVIQEFASMFPGGVVPAGLSLITSDYLMEGKIQYSQMLFSGPVIAAWKAAGAAEQAAKSNKDAARSEVVEQTAKAYLRAIADESQVNDARALVAQARVLAEHAHAAHEAGTAANLDELRARVQLQAQQQVLIAAENRQAKDLILLKRIIGVDPGQAVELTDPAPYSELASETPEEITAQAYQNRPDYQALQSEAVEFKAVHLAYRSQRLPTLSFGGYYVASAVNGAGTHGNFVAQGTLRFPIFREARLRGDEQASRAQLNAVRAQSDDLRGRIDEQVRAALLDVNANRKLVEVGRSNVELARHALSDETDRVNAGVDDNLPLVTAQAALATAEDSLVESLYQYNVSKLALARASGVLEQQYRAYLGQ